MAARNFAANLRIGAVLSSTVGRAFGALNSRIRQQETTLRGLRASYREAGRGVGEYAGRLDELRNTINRAERDLLRLRRAARFDVGGAMKNVGSAFGGDLKRLGMVGGVVGAAGIGIVKNMLDITAEFEKALSSLKTVEGSAEKAQKSFGWVQDFAQTTPYELQQVLEAFIKLKAYGIDPISGDALRILGDTASATGKDLMQAVEAIADATIGQNARLKEAFSIDADLKGSKVLYKYTDKMLKERTVTVNKNNKAQIKSTLLAILNDRYKGAMADQSKTWNGMVSNMKDAWARFAYDVMMSGPFEDLKKKLGGVLEEVGKMAADGRLKAWAEQTGKWMVDTATKIGDVVTTIWGAVKATKDFVGGWGNLATLLVVANFTPTIVAIGQLTAGLWKMAAAAWGVSGPVGILVGVIIAAGAAFAWFITHQDIAYKWLTEKFPNAMRILQDTVYLTVTELKRQFTGAVDAITGAFTTMFDWLGSKFDWFINKAAELGKSVKDLFSWGAEQPPSPMPRGSGLKGPPAGFRFPKTSMIAPPESMPSSNRAMSQSNTVHINVNAPGADGTAIARAARQEINRRPLFDMDGALVPA